MREEERSCDEGKELHEEEKIKEERRGRKRKGWTIKKRNYMKWNE